MNFYLTLSKKKGSTIKAGLHLKCKNHRNPKENYYRKYFESNPNNSTMERY